MLFLDFSHEQTQSLIQESNQNINSVLDLKPYQGKFWHHLHFLSQNSIVKKLNILRQAEHLAFLELQYQLQFFELYFAIQLLILRVIE